MNKIRILIVDDHVLIREGIKALVASVHDVEVVGEAADGYQAVEQARLLAPDVILLDLVMPEKDGLQALPELAECCPATRVLVLTSYTDDDKVFTAIKSGALGYLLKDSTSEELLKAIRSVYRGESSLHPTIARKLILEINRPPEQPSAREPLSSREMEVLSLIARGLSNKEIASQLNLSEHTVNSHIGNILKKLHLANRTQAALYALREGIVDLEGENG
jgi:NarL family two-component system response regulator LiaR